MGGKVKFSYRMHVEASHLQISAWEKKDSSPPASEQLLLWCAAGDTGFPVHSGANEFSLTNQLHLSLSLDSSEICSRG